MRKWMPWCGAALLVAAGACLDIPSSNSASGYVVFAAIGDSGSGTSTQQEVADALATVCTSENCDFAIVLGDNFYDCGVSPVDSAGNYDPQFDSKFNDVYAALDIPFYVVPGNHDYWTVDATGACDMGEAFDDERAWAQVAYSLSNYPATTNFVLPWLPTYELTHPSGWLDLFPLDTQRILWGKDDSGNDGASSMLWDKLATDISSSTANYKIAFGHHAYLSNGMHANVGVYNDITPGASDICDPVTRTPATTTAREAGACLEDYLNENVCGKVDLYIAGHDHNLQFLPSVAACGDTEFIVSGSAGKTRPITGSNPAYFEQEAAGFAVLKICGTLGRLDALTFYDSTGAQLYQYTTSETTACPMVEKLVPIEHRAYEGSKR